MRKAKPPAPSSATSPVSPSRAPSTWGSKSENRGPEWQSAQPAITNSCIPETSAALIAPGSPRIHRSKGESLATSVVWKLASASPTRSSVTDASAEVPAAADDGSGASPNASAKSVR